MSQLLNRSRQDLGLHGIVYVPTKRCASVYVEVPHAQHRALIGRGGQHLNDLQSRTGVQIQFPGSRSYGQVGEGENAADFVNADPQDIVKVSGPRKGCEDAIKELLVSVYILMLKFFC